MRALEEIFTEEAMAKSKKVSLFLLNLILSLVQCPMQSSSMWLELALTANECLYYH